ncbi:hypothetical protein V2J09_016422 [Rumex salicifolius]
MEGSAQHSASHFRPAPPPPSSASAAAVFFKNVYTNGGAAGGSPFTSCEDVFDGPLKYSTTPFAPRAEQYSEIFRSFRSGKACSIPVLDLPPFDDSSAAFDFSGFIYSDIFGSFDIADFALSYDQLFSRSDGSQESSKSDAWMSVMAERQTEVAERFSSEVADDIIFSDVSSGTSAETQSKTSSVPSHGSFTENGRPHGNRLIPTVISVSDPCLTTEPPHAPQTSDVNRIRDPVSSMSEYERPRSNAGKSLFDVSSLDFLNAEFDSGSSGIASAEAIKEAMDTAKVKMKSVRELVEIKKDAVRPVGKNDMNGTERVRMVLDESISRDDVLQPKHESKYNLFKISGKGMQEVSEASQALSDPLQSEKHTAIGAVKPPERKNTRNQSSSKVAVREDNRRGLKDANQLENKEEACTQKRTEGRKRAVSSRDEQQQSDMCLKAAVEGSGKRKNETCEKEESETKPKEVQKIEQHQKNVEDATVSDCYEKKLIQSVEKKIFEEVEVATTNNRTEQKGDTANYLAAKSLKLERSANAEEDKGKLVQTTASENFQKMYEDSAINEEKKLDRNELLAELNSIEQHSYKQRPSIEKNNKLPQMTRKCEDLKFFNLRATLDDKYIKPTAMASACDDILKNHVAELVLVGEERSELRSGTLPGDAESKVTEMAHVFMSSQHLQKTAAQPMIKESKINQQKQSLSSYINQRVGYGVKAINENHDPEGMQNAVQFRRKEEYHTEHLKEAEPEREKKGARELERKKTMNLHLNTFEELREREREKELDKDRLKKSEKKSHGEREIQLEKECIGELDGEWEREREREKDRMGIELKTSARERASTEVDEMAQQAEARQRAMAQARERLEKACADAREKKSLSEKASTEAQLRAERFAAAEARERAIEKAMAERDTFEARVQVARSASQKISSPLRDLGFRHTSSSSDLWNSDKTYGTYPLDFGAEGDSGQRSRARLERHRRTVERVAKALAEKSARDLIAEKEQAEKNSLAESLDGDIKRWSNGKEENLRALLSTLQYILGPDSGWYPIPLTEMIASNAVKKAYRKATLCVHPDKLQQRGATIQQKYICEKVFDLLKKSTTCCTMMRAPKSSYGYNRLCDESFSGGAQAEPRLTRTNSMPRRAFGIPEKLGQEVGGSAAKKTSKKNKSHPVFSLFNSRRKKMSAKPELVRYMEYLKEDGRWDKHL